MSEESLIRAMPDLVAFIRPDGLITDHLGGNSLPFLLGAGDLVGHRIQELLEPAAGAMILRLIRRALAERDSCETAFTQNEDAYRVRVQAQGPERAMCVMQYVAGAALPAHPGTPGAHADGFPGRLRDAVADASLRERSFAVCAIFLDGLADIGALIDFSLRQQVLDTVLQRVRAAANAESAAFVEIIGDSVLGAIVTEGERDPLRSAVESIAASIHAPVRLHDATFVLAPHIGVAIFGKDASNPQTLLDHARAAMFEARRAEAGSIQFYSDTVRMLPVVRLDIERELREAIDAGQITLHYRGRHNLSDGRLTGVDAYLRWMHPLRGEIAPAEFLRIAETTDLAPAVSQAALARLALDLPHLRRRFGTDLPICFGPLRQHLCTEQFLRDVFGARHAGAFTSGGFMLRIAERTLGALSDPKRLLDELLQAQVACVIDEMGSGTISLSQLAQLPIAALQITRRYVVAAPHDAAALRTCRSVVALAEGLGVEAIAPGIDANANRECLSGMGCAHGLGDLYPPVAIPDIGRRGERRARAI